GDGVSNGSVSVSAGTSQMMTLSIGGNGPASGENVTVNGGKLYVYDTTTIGDQNNAALVLNSGTLNSYAIQLGNTVFGASTTTYTGSLTINGGVVETSNIALGGGSPGAWTTGGSIIFNAGTISAIGTLSVNAPISLGGNVNIDTNGNAGTLSGNITGTGSITKWDTGAATLSGNNTITGSLCVRGGTLNLSGTNSISNGVFMIGGSVGITTDANLGGTTTPISFQGGLLRINGNSLSNIDSHAVNWSTFNGGFEIASASNTFTVASTVSGNGSMSKSGPGLLILTASNSYTGGTTLSAGELGISDVNNIGGAGRTLTFAGGELRVLGTSLANLDNMNVNWPSFNGAIDVNDPNNTFAINSVIGGSGGLIKDGPGTLLLNAANTFTGNTIINAGVLKLGNALAIQNSTLNFPGTGGALDLNGFSLNIGGIAGSGGFDLGGGVLTVGDNNVSTTFAGVISDTVGGGKLVKVGTGNLTLTGASSYALNIVVNGGGGIGATGNVAASGNTPFGTKSAGVVLDGGKLVDTGSSNIAWDRLFTLGPGGGTLEANSPHFVFNSTGTVPFSSTGNSTLTLSGSNVDNELKFKLADPTGGKLALNKVGSGRWILTVGSSQAWTYSGDTTINGGTLIMNSSNAILPFGAGKGNLVITSGTFSMNGRSNVQINGLNGPGTVVSGTNFTIGNGDANGAFSGHINSVTGITKTGAGLQVFSGSNGYSGATAINGGILQFNVATAIGGSGASVTVASGAAAAAGYAMDQTFLNRIVTTSSGAAVLAANSGNALSLSSFANLSLGSVGSVALTGALTPNGTNYRLGGGTGTLSLPNASALTGARTVQIVSGGAILLANTENYTGDTTVNSGAILSLGVTNALPFGSGNGNLNLSGTLNLGNNNTTLDGLNGAGSINQGGTSARSLTIGANNANGNFSGILSGGTSFNVLKTGSGSQSLTGSNTWGGGTTVNAGTLVLNNTNDGSVNIGGGALVISAKANSMTPAGTSVVPSVSITSGQLDLTNNGFVIDYTPGNSPATNVQQMVQSGAITSSLGDSTHHVGFAESSTIGVGTGFGGATLDGTSIAMRLTVDGDANLDGTVNISDFNQLAANFGGTGQIWGGGDFNNDGVVNLLDLNALATEFGQTAPAPLPSLGSLVPEPASGAMLIGLMFAARRRRSNRHG
ncbi:MAG TPA: autotransporter-associated beta strand repeat-containing protein, partial [Tepidisphaeraceae bacterium]|nr:autotransporter-associated beta strand repeat-containing protein [Tepidisphaeraceae bacterium]